MGDYGRLRREFVNRLTLDGAKDMRRWDYNEAIFTLAWKGGWAVWDRTTLVDGLLADARQCIRKEVAR